MNILKRGNKHEVVEIINKAQLYTIGFIGRETGGVDFANMHDALEFLNHVGKLYIDFDWAMSPGSGLITYSSRTSFDEDVIKFEPFIKSLYEDGLDEEHKIFDSLTIVMGKTFSGKTNYVESAIKNDNYDRVKTHTTRPKRLTETGDEYYFEDDVDEANSIALRSYETAQGVWSYWTSLDDFKNKKNPILILDFEGTIELLDYLIGEYGDEILNKISILYMNKPLQTIIERANDSARGKSEDPRETLRRLADDIKQFEDLDYLVDDRLYGEIEVSDDVLSFAGLK